MGNLSKKILGVTRTLGVLGLSVLVAPSAQAFDLSTTTETDKYLLIGTTSSEIAKAVNVQNGDLGADMIVLSTEFNDNVDFDLDDVFLNNAGSQWVDVDNQYNPDSALQKVALNTTSLGLII